MFAIAFHGLVRMVRTESELTSAALSSWLGDWPNARPLFTHNSTTYKNADIYPCLDLDSSPPPQCLSDPGTYAP